MYEKPNIPDDDLRAVFARAVWSSKRLRLPFCRWALTAWPVCTGL